jgi:hypothetical protein
VQLSETLGAAEGDIKLLEHRSPLLLSKDFAMAKLIVHLRERRSQRSAAIVSATSRTRYVLVVCLLTSVAAGGERRSLHSDGKQGRC